MAKITLTDISSGYLSTSTFNANNTLIETAIEKTLSRDGTTPNTMSANLDLNSNKIVNITDGANNQDAVSLAQLNAAKVTASTIAATAVTFADSGANYAATTAEAAFAELASASNGEGASIIKIEDSGGNYTATEVEAAFTELHLSPTSSKKGLIELATQTEVNTGSDGVRAITPVTLATTTTLNHVTVGSFTATLTGCTTSPTSTVLFFKHEYSGGKMRVDLVLEGDLTGTSNTTAMTITGVASSVQIQSGFPTEGVSTCILTNNSGDVFGSAVVTIASGTITFAMGAPLSTTGFTNSGTKGLVNGTKITYYGVAP